MSSLDVARGSVAYSYGHTPNTPHNIIDTLLEDRIRSLSDTELLAAQAEFSNNVAAAGLNFEGRPYPVCIRPLAISIAQMRKVGDIAEQLVTLLDTVAALYCEDKAVRHLFSAYHAVAHLATSIPPLKPIVRVCRFDGLFGSDGEYRILETNTEGPGGVIQNGLAGRAWSRAKNPLTSGLPLDTGTQPFVRDPDCFLKELIASHRHLTGQDPKRVAIVNYKGRFTNEVDWMVGGLKRLGIDAALVDAASLVRSRGRIFDATGNRVDLAYNKLDIRDTIGDPAIMQYLDACAAGEITSINPLIAQWILSDKAILAVISDKKFAEHFTKAQRQLIGAHVPWTRLVVDGRTSDHEGKPIDLISYITANRRRLVLKPSNATRGESVAVGRFTTPNEWNLHIKRAALQPYVVQEYVQPPEVTVVHPFNNTIERMGVGLDAYVFGGRLAGFQARASLDAVMNVGKRGVLLPVATYNVGDAA